MSFFAIRPAAIPALLFLQSALIPFAPGAAGAVAAAATVTVAPHKVPMTGERISINAELDEPSWRAPSSSRSISK